MPGCISGYQTAKAAVSVAAAAAASGSVEPKVSFHAFPSDKDLKQKWLKTIHRKS